jgi:hypothetical protein
MPKQRKPRCVDCGSTEDVFRMPLEPEGNSALLCKSCAELAVTNTLEAQPETYVRVPGGGWALREQLN